MVSNFVLKNMHEQTMCRRLSSDRFRSLFSCWCDCDVLVMRDHLVLWPLSMWKFSGELRCVLDLTLALGSAKRDGRLIGALRVPLTLLLCDGTVVLSTQDALGP